MAAHTYRHRPHTLRDLRDLKKRATPKKERVPPKSGNESGSLFTGARKPILRGMASVASENR